MKKIVFIFVLLTNLVYGQCNIDNSTPSNKGLYSNPLPVGSIGVSYNQSVTMVFPTHSDTTITVPGFGSQTFTAYYTSFQVQQVSGVPQGLSMPLSTCNQNNCIYTITQSQTNRGCMLLSGTPTESGTFQVTTTNYANGYTIMPFTIPFTGPNAGDTLNFDDPRIGSVPVLSGVIAGFRTQTFVTPLQILTTSTSKPQMNLDAVIYPNPGKNSLLKWKGLGETKISVVSSLGNIVTEINVVSTGENSLELPNLPNGLYFIKIQNSDISQSLKWISE